MLEQKKLHDLQFGDIIQWNVPFAHNTSDYYNGYPPQLIVDELTTDSQGRTEKFRPIMVLKVTDLGLTYAPLTSRSPKWMDEYHLQANDAIPNSHKYDTYVKVSDIREDVINPAWQVNYCCCMDDRDIEAITQLFAKKAHFEHPIRNVRHFTPVENLPVLQQHFEDRGYKQIEEDDEYILLERRNRRVELGKDGFILCSHNRSLDQVRELHAPSVAKLEHTHWQQQEPKKAHKASQFSQR